MSPLRHQIKSSQITSIKKLIQEMEFEQDSPEFVACIKCLETIKPKRKFCDTTIVIDLVSRSESPKKIAKATY